MICPCKDCEEQGCGKKHDSCEPYIRWQTWRGEVNKTRHEDAINRELSRDQEMKYRNNLRHGRVRK